MYANLASTRDTIRGSCGRDCRPSSSARMLTTKPRTGRCFYTNFRTRPSTSPARLSRRRRRSYGESAQLLITPSSSQTLHHHRIGADASAHTMAMVIRPGQRLWAGRRRHGNADTHGSPTSPAVPARTMSPNCCARRRAGPKRREASRGSDPDQRPTRRHTVPAHRHGVVAYRSSVALPTIMTRDAAMHRQGVGAAGGV